MPLFSLKTPLFTIYLHICYKKLVHLNNSCHCPKAWHQAAAAAAEKPAAETRSEER